MASAFQGFPAEALDFYTGLEADNSKTYWHRHKSTFDQAVRAPMVALVESVSARYQPFHLFRPYRDVRFSADKSPYKTAQGAASQTEGGAGHYVQVAAAGVMTGAGMYRMARDQLERFRSAVVADDSGDALAGVVADLRSDGFAVTAHDPPLKTAPRGYSTDHPRIELLRWKGCLVMAEIDDPAVIGTSDLVDTLSELWSRWQPLVDWLGEHVGPTHEPEARQR